MLWWIAMGNKWNLRQLAWPKPNDVKLQSLASWTHQASRALGREYEVGEGAIRKVWGNRENILRRNPVYWDIRWIWTKCYVPTSKALKLSRYIALSSTSTTNCFALMFKRAEVGQMYDELRWSFETFLRNVNKLTFNVKHKKSMHSQQMTLLHCMTCSNNLVWALIFVEKMGAYLSGRLL